MKKAGGGLGGRAQRLPTMAFLWADFIVEEKGKKWKKKSVGANETDIGECGRLEEESSSIESSRKMERWRDGTHAYDEKIMKER